MMLGTLMPSNAEAGLNLDDMLSYKLDNWGSRVLFAVGAGNFSLHHHIQNSSGAHLAYPMGSRGTFPGGKVARV